MSNSRNKQNYLSYPGKQPRTHRSVYNNNESICGRNLCNKVTLNESLKQNSTKSKYRFSALSMAIKSKNQLATASVYSVGSKLRRKEVHEQTFSKTFSTYLKAFALIYVLPEEEWRAEIIEKLLQEGEELFNQNENKMVVGQRIRRNFKLEGHNFTVELKPIYEGDPKISAKLRPEHTIKNLKFVLQGFFSTAHYCLLFCSTGYLLIWRRRKLYFIMDIKGSRLDDSASVRQGLAMLVCLQTIDKVVHLISNLSDIKPRDAFSIREISVVRLVTPEGRIFVRETNQQSVEYNVINNNYAYLKSTLHLSLNPESTLRNQSSLVVGVTTLLASKIDHPASWNTNMLDRLMCYGVQLFRSFWGVNARRKLPIDLDKFPTQLRIGQFVVELRLIPFIVSGQWRCGVCYKGNDFERTIRQSLIDYGNCLFQINRQIYTVWLKDNFYYLLDPYQHTVVGAQGVDDDKSTKWATVRMFRDWTIMLSVFHQLLKASNRNARFSLHVVCIRNIARCPVGYALKPLPPETDYDVQSINETIHFSEDVKDSLQVFGRLSEYPLDAFSETGETLDLENFRLLDEGDEYEEISNNYPEEFYLSPEPPYNSVGPYVCKPTVSGVASTNGKRKDVTTESVKKETSMKPPIKPPTRRKGGAEADFGACKQNAPFCKFPDFVPTAVKESERNINAGIIQCKCEENSNLGSVNQEGLQATSQTSYHTAGFSPSKCGLIGCADSIIQPISFPVYSKYPHKLAIAGSESGTLESLDRLLKSAFSVTNRVLTITPWGNYVIFKKKSPKRFYLFDGCTCNIDRFRHLDLKHGTAGLKPFDNQSQVVCYMIDSRESRALKVIRTRLDESNGQVKSALCRGA